MDKVVYNLIIQINNNQIRSLFNRLITNILYKTPCGYPLKLMATWRNGYAEDCKSLYPGSIPGVASKKILVLVIKKSKLSFLHSSVAQLVEQLTVNQLVVGSSPTRGAKISIF